MPPSEYNWTMCLCMRHTPEHVSAPEKKKIIQDMDYIQNLLVAVSWFVCMSLPFNGVPCTVMPNTSLLSKPIYTKNEV